MRPEGRLPWRALLLFAGPPTAWMVHLLVSYLLVAPTCGDGTWPLHLTTVLAVLGLVSSLALGRRVVAGDRRRAVAAGVLGGVFLFATLLQAAANVAVDPCA